MSSILAPHLPDDDAPTLDDENCPRPDCSGSLDVGDKITDGAYDIECSDCEYWEHRDTENDIPARPEGIVESITNFIATLTWPYTALISNASIVGMLALFVYGLFSPFNEWQAATLIPVIYLLMKAEYPDTYCPSCNRGVTPPDGDDRLTADGYCANCGEYYTEPLTLVDPHAKPVYERLHSWLAASTPDWIRIDGIALNIETDEGDALMNRLIGSRRRVWLRILDVGTLAFAAIYAVVLYAIIAGAARGLAAFSTFTVSIPEFVGTNSNAAPPADPLATTIDILIGLAGLVGEVWIPFAAGLSATVVLHELGHGIALRLHGHDVEEFGGQLLYGIIPNYGYAMPDFDALENRGLRAALHVDTAGVTMNLLTALPVAGVWLLAGGSHPSTGILPVDWLWYGVAIGSVAIGPLNVLPFFGTDGQHFQEHSLHYLTDSYLPVPHGAASLCVRAGLLVAAALAILGLLAA